MKFSEIVKQAVALLQDSGRVSYRSLKIEFDLSDDHLDALKDELIDILELATDKGGKMLVWTGDGDITAATKTESSSQPPARPSSPSS